VKQVLLSFFILTFLTTSDAQEIISKNCLKTVLDAKDKTPEPFAIVQVDKAFFYTDSLGCFSISEKVVLKKSENPLKNTHNPSWYMYWNKPPSAEAPILSYNPPLSRSQKYWLFFE
jgi:hypothetical protein